MGIARHVNWPRTKCSILGSTIDGRSAKGEYVNTSFSFSEGFDANAIYFKLGFLDKTSVALGRQFKELLPIIWMKAGCHGQCPTISIDNEVPEMLILPENRLAVLIDERYFAEFQEKISKLPEIDFIFLVTNSEIAYQEMALSFEDKQTYHLYRDYLDNFRLNVRK